MAKIFSVSVRAGIDRAFDPIARLLLRARVAPDAVTVAGTVGVLVGAFGWATRGQWIIATVVITLSAFSDLIDGSMARQLGKSRKFGAFLDSTMDRIADGAIFGSVAYYFAVQQRHWALVAALVCLVSGQLVSYVRARAEGLGLHASVGIAERAERLILLGLGGLASGFGWRPGMEVALWLLAGLSVVTIGQRIGHVHRLDRETMARESVERAAADPEVNG
jgi:CDP-diacylglycerol--glycerol-3-phosphate 3-phosphatidyltransferase